jgi:hypothetical protein
MKDQQTLDLFDDIVANNKPSYGNSQAVIDYNKRLNRKHNDDDVYFLGGSGDIGNGVVFHHLNGKKS